jgi:protein TonB
MAQLAINPQLPPYRAEFPPELKVPGNRAWAMVKVCAGRDGQVEVVTFLKSAHPLLDERIRMAIRTWRYRPYLVNGQPVPVCTNVHYEMTAR